MRQILLYIFLLFVCSVSAEQFKITGKVVDTNNEPMIGGTVMIKGTDRGTTTDIDGNFGIEVETGAILKFSYVGYISKEIDKYHLLDISPVPRCVIEMFFDGDKPMDFKFHYVNDAMVKLFGKESKEDLLGKTFREAFDNINEKWLDFYAPTALYGTPRRVVINSTEIQKELYVRAYQPFYGYVVSIMQDISLIEEALERREEF